MKTKRAHEGYLVIDNRGGPGVSAEFVQRSGKDVPFATEGQIYESATFTCKHCSTIVVLNPNRIRPRAYCPGCDHYICDACESQRMCTGCRPIERIFDELLNQAAKGEQ